MVSNRGKRHIELVDSALIEPGRVAVTAEFGLADKEIMAGLFHLAYNDHEEAGGLLAEEFRRKDSGAGIQPGRGEVIFRVEFLVTGSRY